MRIGRYVDEQILQLKNHYKNRTEQRDIRQGVRIKGRWERFVPCKALEGQATIWLPETFTEMPTELAVVRYPIQYRPKALYIGTDVSENLAFHLLERGNRNAGECIEQMQQTVLRHAPETVIYENGKITGRGMEGRWFESKNFTVEEEIYQIQMIVCSEQYLLAGAFCCLMRYFEEWKSSILQSFALISLEQEEQEEG